YDSLRRARLPASLIQAQRDYFGAHTYERLDRPGSFDTDWTQKSPEVELHCMAMDDVLAIILGGGRGTRLFPLTFKRSKPAVPIGGKYRLIDIPISNCLNANLRQIFVLTQFNSESLNRHVAMTYKFDVFSSGFVSVLAAEQTGGGGNWFQGTAGAAAHRPATTGRRPAPRRPPEPAPHAEQAGPRHDDPVGRSALQHGLRGDARDAPSQRRRRDG